MANVLFVPSSHRCLDELDELGEHPVGTIAECSCGEMFKLLEHQFDGPYWSRMSQLERNSFLRK